MKLILIGLILIMAPMALAVPPIAAEYYGNLKIDGNDALNGTHIVLTDTSGIICGEQKTNTAGSYGLISCKGDDPSTGADEGASGGEQITFFVDGIKAGKHIWREGQLLRYDFDVKTVHVFDATTYINLGAIIILILITAAAVYFYIRRQEK